MSILKQCFLSSGKYMNGRMVAGLMCNQFQFSSNDYVNENKRPGSPFALFFKEKHIELRRDNPHMTPTDIMKLASNLWKSQSWSDQQLFRNEFEEKLQLYKQTIKELPKKPPTAYLQFFKEKSQVLETDYPNVVERAKQCGNMWQNLPEDDKMKYRQLYELQLQIYNENLTEEEKVLLQEKKDLKKKRKAKKSKLTN